MSGTNRVIPAAFKVFVNVATGMRQPNKLVVLKAKETSNHLANSHKVAGRSLHHDVTLFSQQKATISIEVHPVIPFHRTINC
jgi:hypothetical protein